MFNTQMILSQLMKMFPGNQNEIQEAVKRASQAVQGATDDQAGDIARNFGITEQGINELYNRYGSNPMAKTLLSLVGTSPEQLKQQGLNIVKSGGVNRPQSSNKSSSNSNKPKFPRLK